MNLEQQVSLELSKQLKEAGYKQEGLWWWVNFFNKDKNSWEIISEIRIKLNSIRKECIFNVASTVAELGERLPQFYYTKKAKEGWRVMEEQTSLACKDTWLKATSKQKGIFADTEADARAKMWLYLKKEGLLK